MSARYVEKRGWQTRVLRNPEGRAAIRAFANDYKAAVPGNVPIHTGELQAQYEKTGRVRSGPLDLGTPTMRYSVAPKNEDGIPLAGIIEYGSVKSPPYAPLRRTADELGLHWEGK